MALGKQSALAVKRLVKHVERRRRGIPHAELVRFAREVRALGEVTVDFAAAREIGLPVVVLRPAPNPELLALLTPREREVVSLLATGHRNDEIASELKIALSTVKDHVHRALEKTGMASRTELAVALRA